MKISKCTASGQFHYFPRTLLVIFKIFSLVEKQNKRKELIFHPIYQALHGRPSTSPFIPFIPRHHPLYLTLSLICSTEHIPANHSRATSLATYIPPYSGPNVSFHLPHTTGSRRYPAHSPILPTATRTKTKQALNSRQARSIDFQAT